MFQFVVVIYNPVGRPVDHWVRLPVVGGSYQVTGPDGKTVQTQVGNIQTYSLNIYIEALNFIISLNDSSFSFLNLLLN